MYKIVFFTALLLFNACAKGISEWQGKIEEKNGVMFINNPKEPKNPDLKIIFEEELTIGAIHGEDNDMLGSQIFLNTDDEGNFYVSDKDISTVKKYNSNGKFLQLIGGNGQGPGEFQDICEVRFSIDGNMYVNDVSTQRLSFLTKTGQYLRGVKFPTIFERVVINSKGYFIAMSVDNVQLGQGKKWDYFYGLFDAELNQIAEFLRLPQEEKGLSKNGYSINQAFADDLSARAFAPNVNYVLDKNDWIYFGYPKDYEIKVYSPDGELKRIIQRDYKPIEISKSHKEHFRQNQSVQFMAKMPVGEEDTIYKLVRYPKYKPAYERFTLMENGWIFVVVDSTHNTAQLVDIFNENGEYLAQFETNIAAEQLFFNNGKAYTVATIDDYKFIKRFKFDIL